MGTFNANIRNARARRTSSTILDETYDLRGLNLVTPDPVAPEYGSPYLLNTRMYAREEEDGRVAQRTRKGSVKLSTPVGEALNIANTATHTVDSALSASVIKAQPFVPSSDGRLTKLELSVKISTEGGGHLTVDIYTDNSGSPGEKITSSCISANQITSSYQYLPAYFMDAPLLESGETYWMVLGVQKYGAVVYHLDGTAASGGLTSALSPIQYSSLGHTWRYKTYLSTNLSIKGFTKRYPSDPALARTMFAAGTGIYAMQNNGTVTSIDSSVNSASTKVRFDHIDDKTIWVDGISRAKWWDGTTVTEMNNVPGNPILVKIYENRAFFVPEDDRNRINFSALYSFEDYPSVNFFYVGNPKSSDDIQSICDYQDSMVIFTRNSKYKVYGNDISSFTMKQAQGTRGAVSDEAVAVDKDYIYFMAPDKQIYRYNGVDDDWISEKIEPLLNSISDTSKVRFHLHRNQLRVYFPAGADTEAQDMVLLELPSDNSNKLGEWFHDKGRAVAGSISWHLDDNELIEFSSKVGAVYRGEIGETDLGKAISWRYWTPYKTYGSGSAKDRVRKFRVYARPGDWPYDIMVGKDVDFRNNVSFKNAKIDGGSKWDDPNTIWDDPSFIWDNAVEIVNPKIAMSGRGEHTQYRFECDSLDAPVEIYGYMSLVKSGRVK